jgi:hypothetical protein
MSKCVEFFCHKARVFIHDENKRALLLKVASVLLQTTLYPCIIKLTFRKRLDACVYSPTIFHVDNKDMCVICRLDISTTRQK